MNPTVKNSENNSVRIKKIFDNQGKTMDRYTIFFEELVCPESDDWIECQESIFASDDVSPRGVFMTNCTVCKKEDDEVEISFENLPNAVQKRVINYMAE